MRRDTAAEQKVEERSQDTFWLTAKWPEERKMEEGRRRAKEETRGEGEKSKIG